MLKQKLGVHVQAGSVREVEPIHTPSFSIGESLGEIKVALMDLKTRSERIEGSMLSREYFDEALLRKNKCDLIVTKLDDALQVLTEFEARKPSIEPRRPSLEPRTPSSTEEAEGWLQNAVMSTAEDTKERHSPAPSLRLQQVLDVFKNRRRTTPKQLAQLLGIATNTACEHLRTLERLGLVQRIRRGLYEAA
jgi:ribosomal protein S25